MEWRIDMFNGDFAKELNNLLDNPGSYTKDEIYEAFLKMSERYLSEMVNTMNLERAVTEGMDRESASERIEEIAISDPDIADLDDRLISTHDDKERIRILLEFTKNNIRRSRDD